MNPTATATISDVKRLLRQRGGTAIKSARKTINQTFKDDSAYSQALRYFSKNSLRKALPVFPALISISCEAVGGDFEKTTPFGEAIVHISAAADLHDDVIDQSFVKGSNQTVLGKFNMATTILAGDILLVQGLRQLNEACQLIEKEQANKIIRIVYEAIFEICAAESFENQFHGKNEITQKEFEDIIRLKAVVPEMSMKIGAIIGKGSDKDVKNLGFYGRNYGINSLIIEEFTDLLDIQEMKNRLRNECPPLPIIYAFKNPGIKNYLNPLLKADLDPQSHKKISEVVLQSAEIRTLGSILVSNAKSAISKLPETVGQRTLEELKNLMLVPLNYIEI